MCGSMMHSFAERFRPIEDLVPLLYPGVKVSYGTIQQMLVEAEGRAARFNAQVSLGGVEAGALDEMFSQGEPVGRGGPRLGVSVRVVVECDARWGGVGGVASRGSGAGAGAVGGGEGCVAWDCAGVSEVFPHAEQPDVFRRINHVVTAFWDCSVKGLGRCAGGATECVRGVRPVTSRHAHGESSKSLKVVVFERSRTHSGRATDARGASVPVASGFKCGR